MSQPDLLVRQVRLLDPSQGKDEITDIIVDDGRVREFGSFPELDAGRAIDGTELIASPGWIDLHAHVVKGASAPGVNADRDAGVHAGVTTVVDAGSCGMYSWNNIKHGVAEIATTRVLAYLSISNIPVVGPRHGDWNNFSQGKTIAFARKEADAGLCVGIKVLASQTHCGNMGIIPVQLAKQAARLSGTGLMVHIGNAPPLIDDVLNLLEEGDVVTHCWHGKYGGLFDRHGKPLPETMAAVERGVKWDIGHGSASFAFKSARLALDAGLPLHAISTDIHRGNTVRPVVDMATTMSKFLHLGFSLHDVIRLSTISPATLLQRDRELGSLAPGREADITLFRIAEGHFALTDSEGVTETATQKLEVSHTIRSGRVVHEPDAA